MDIGFMVALVGGVFVVFSALLNKHTEICKMKNSDLASLRQEVSEFYVFGSNMIGSLKWAGVPQNPIDPDLGTPEYTCKMYEGALEKAISLNSKLSLEEGVDADSNPLLDLGGRKRKCVEAIRGVESFCKAESFEDIEECFLNAHEMLNNYLVSKKKSIRSLKKEVLVLLGLIILMLLVAPDSKIRKDKAVSKFKEVEQHLLSKF